MEIDQFWFQYFSSYYYSTLAFALADIAPRSTRQIMFMAGVIILNMIGYSTIIGIFVDTLLVLSTESM